MESSWFANLFALFLFRSVVEDVDWRCLLTFYTPVLALILVSLFFYWSSQRLMSKKLIYNRSMQHFQVNFDLFTKFLLVVGIWWLFHALAALLQRTALTYISMAFNIIIGPLVFLGKQMSLAHSQLPQNVYYFTINIMFITF